jgi:hypothetical protein
LVTFAIICTRSAKNPMVEEHHDAANPTEHR